MAEYDAANNRILNGLKRLFSLNEKSHLPPLSLPLSVVIRKEMDIAHTELFTGYFYDTVWKMNLIDTNTYPQHFVFTLDEQPAIEDLLHQQAQRFLSDNNLFANFSEYLKDTLIYECQLNGNLDYKCGTVEPLRMYGDSDPVAKFYAKENASRSLVGSAWNIELDCKYLRSAMRGIGTEADAIIALVTSRSAVQRLRIADLYEATYKRNLMDDMKEELSGNLEEAVLALFCCAAEYDAHCVHKALSAFSMKKDTLIEVFCSRTCGELSSMSSAYELLPKNKTRSSLADELRAKTDSHLQAILIDFLYVHYQSVKDEALADLIEPLSVNDDSSGQSVTVFKLNMSRLVNDGAARRKAKELFEITAGDLVRFSLKNGYHPAVVHLLLATHPLQLRVVFNEYVKLTQKDILNVNDEHIAESDYLKVVKSKILCTRSLPIYYALRLRAALLAGDTDALIRIVVARSEVDLVQIKRCFVSLFRRSLWQALNEDTSGDIRRLLLAIVQK